MIPGVVPVPYFFFFGGPPSAVTVSLIQMVNVVGKVPAITNAKGAA